MKLSIVIPCYNCAQNIIPLLTLLWQQRRDEVEVILVNDGSTDNSESLINAFILAHPQAQFSCYTTPNAGAAAARAFGLSLAQGEYLFFCDSDDAVAPDFVATVLEKLTQQPDLLYFSSVILRGTGAQQTCGDKVFFPHDAVYLDADQFLRWQLKRRAYTAAVWTYVFRRSLLDKSQACFTPRKSHEDHLFTLRLIAHARKIVVIHKKLYFQQITAGSLTNSAKDGHYIAERYSAFLEARADMLKTFSKDCINLYSEWSIKSFFELCIGNPFVIFSQRKLYASVWRDRVHFSRVFKNIIFQRFSGK